MKYTFFFTMLFLFTFSVFSQSLNNEQFLEVQRVLPLENNPNKKADLLYSSALHYLNRKGEYKKDLDSGVFFVKKALHIYKQLDIKKDIAQSMLLYARIEWENGKSNKAISLKNKALDYVHLHNLKMEEAEIYVHMGWGLAENATFQEKIDNFNKAISLYQENGAIYEEGQTNYWVGYMYESLKHTDSAFKYIHKAIKLKKSLPPPVNMYEEYRALSIIFRNQANYQEALKYALEAVRNAESVNALPEWLTRVYNNLGEIYNELKMVDKSIEYYKKAIEMAKKNNDSDMVKIISSNQEHTLQFKYKNEQKEKSFQLLKQHTKLQEAEIRISKIIRYVVTGCLILMLLFVGLLYNRSRIKQRANKELEAKQQQINEQNDELKNLVTEKEWLLKEIHHRVKNNLQIVISLLNTQSAYLDNKDALMAIQNSQNRMHAMSLIHQKLYQSDNLASIDMSWYIHELINYLKESFDLNQKVSYKIDTERLELDVVQAVPLGLILNEAISNAMKYAFNGKDDKQISISLKNIGSDTFKLIIADNGRGLPDGFETHDRDSLGMNLMMGLADQLDGAFKLESNNGVTVSIQFAKKRQMIDAESAIN